MEKVIVKEKRHYNHKSFYMTDNDKMMLEYLAIHYGLNQGSVMRKILTEAYTILNYEEQLKKKKV